MAFSNTNMLQQYQDNLVRILLLVSQQIVNPTQTNVDAINTAYQAAVAANTASGANLVTPRPDYNLDGENYQWDKYRSELEKSIAAVQHLIVMLGGNYLIRSQGRV